MRQPITVELISILEEDQSLRAALLDAITQSSADGIHDIDTFCSYIDDLVVTVPDDSNRLIPFSMEIYFISAHSQVLQKSESYQTWLVDVAKAWGRFLDTPASIADLEKYVEDPCYKIDQYDRGPSGWMSFNQFFARQVKPGMRIVAALTDPSVVVSSTDSTFMGALSIQDGEIAPKGHPLKIDELMNCSYYADHFRDGVFTHSFLGINDYHRYHTPLAGQVLEVEKIPGQVQVDFKKDEKGRIVDQPTLSEGYLFTQDRGLMVLETEAGLVALLPIGMAQISSVTITPDVGAFLQKGQEFGYFQFGGSDVITVFENDRVTFDAKPGDLLCQGEAVGTVKL